MRVFLSIISLLVATSSSASEVRLPPVFSQVAGEIQTVDVKPGDTLVGLAGRLGVPWQTVATLNGISNPDQIYAGQVLEVDTRRIVPQVIDEGAVVNTPESTLYVFEGGSLAARYPVGLGRAARPTPIGSLTVLFKENSAAGKFPPSVAEEIRREGRVLDQKAPPDAQNPLGVHWIQLSTWGYGIHSTPFAASVGQFLGYGSIRVGKWDIEDLYRRVEKGTRVELTYLPVKVAVTPGSEVWVEAHPDVYGRGEVSREEVLEALHREGAADWVDEKALDEVLRRRLGVAQRVGAAPAQGSAEGNSNGGPPEETDVAVWRCLDCPPGPNRRVTFQIEARGPIDLPNPYPLEIRDDASRVVFRPQMVAQVIVHLEPGQSRNFVWEVRDTEGQPLPPGSYSAVIRFFAGPETGLQTLSLPLWVGN